MASFCRYLHGRRRSFVPCLLQSRRHGHGQILWERLLGRKIDSSLANALDDAASQFTASQRMPSWLPFLPNSSFWLPPSEDAEKKFEDLIDLLDDAPLVRSSNIHENSPLDTCLRNPRIAAHTAIQNAEKLQDAHEDASIDKGIKVLLSDLLEDIEDEDASNEDLEDEDVVVEVADGDDSDSDH